jgi:hypothetical protein
MPGSGFPWEQKTPLNFMNIEIPQDCTHINVLFSGGADSTLLSYLLLKQHPETSLTLHFMKHRLDFQSPFMYDCHTWLENHFNKKIHLNIWGKTFIRPAVESILLDFPGYVYTGCNKVPENEFTPSVYIPYDTPPVRGSVFNDFHKRPFIDLLKPEIYKIYHKENILDLFSLTFSCGAPKKQENRVTACGGCFFCMERDWAVKNNINNTQTPRSV